MRLLLARRGAFSSAALPHALSLGLTRPTCRARAAFRLFDDEGKVRAQLHEAAVLRCGH